jgi:DNA mismatch repair protein MutH
LHHQQILFALPQCVLAASAEDQAEEDFVHFGVLKTILMEQLKVVRVLCQHFDFAWQSVR